MKSRTPKALLHLAGLPLLLHSIATFARVREVLEIVLVLPAGRVSKVWQRLAAKLGRLRVTKVVGGGPRRQDSVLRGLRMTTPRSEVVLVHDSARPFVDGALIRRVAAAAHRFGAAVPGLRVRDTIKRVDRDDRVVETLDRRELWMAQTPQGFRRQVLIDAYAAGYGREDATDDAQVVERAGATVAMVEGDPANFKITSREDLALAETVYQRLY